MEELKKDYKKFFTKDKFQWYLIIVGFMVILRAINLLSPGGFEEAFIYISVGLFVAEGANQLTNFRGLK